MRCQATIWCATADGAPEATHLGRHLGVGEVTHDLVDPGDGELVVGVVVDLADDLLGVPGEPHLPLRVAGSEQAEQLSWPSTLSRSRAITSRRRQR